MLMKLRRKVLRTAPYSYAPRPSAAARSKASLIRAPRGIMGGRETKTIYRLPVDLYFSIQKTFSRRTWRFPCDAAMPVDVASPITRVIHRAARLSQLARDSLAFFFSLSRLGQPLFFFSVLSLSSSRCIACFLFAIFEFGRFFLRGAGPF